MRVGATALHSAPPPTTMFQSTGNGFLPRLRTLVSQVWQIFVALEACGKFYLVYDDHDNSRPRPAFFKFHYKAAERHYRTLRNCRNYRQACCVAHSLSNDTRTRDAFLHEIVCAMPGDHHSLNDIIRTCVAFLHDFKHGNYKHSDHNCLDWTSVIPTNIRSLVSGELILLCSVYMFNEIMHLRKFFSSLRARTCDSAIF